MNQLHHILHVDMDAFFASVEQLDQPELRGKPVLVGTRPEERGVVAAASYEARKFGCRSAMPMGAAMRLCPEAVVVPPRGKRYAEVSAQVFQILVQFTPLVEPLSIDEAFLDVTGSVRLFGQPEEIAREVKRRIQAETELTASVGVAPNKFLAKLASDLDKPDGLMVVPQDGIQAFLDPLPISRLWGVGKATLPRFEELGIRTFADTRRLSEAVLRDRFGEAGGQFYRLIRGIDDREVVPDTEAKSISQEVTFPVDVDDHEHLRGVLLGQTDQVARRLRRHGLLARTVTLKIRSGDFKTITRSRTIEVGTDETQTIWVAVTALFNEWSSQQPPAVRLIGVGVSQLSNGAGQQLSLFGQEESFRHRQLDQAIDKIRDKFGDGAIGRGGVRGKDAGDV
ncbi:MAG: DNA polymerase IV [Phycisphaerales bacterium]|nr:DNA polymerase IV [Phycisphaerales bacterium]